MIQCTHNAISTHNKIILDGGWGGVLGVGGGSKASLSHSKDQKKFNKMLIFIVKNANHGILPTLGLRF